MSRSPKDISFLFLDDGSLDRSRFSPSGIAVLDRCVEWLEEVDRSVFLPIDLLAILVERGHEGLVRAVAGAARGDEQSIADQLRSLARRVERDNSTPPRLHLDLFSLGFTGILNDALAWAIESGRDTVSESDLVRVIRWRAELQESASVRWAIRQLAQPGGEFLFESDGSVRRPSFTPETWLLLVKAMRLSCHTGLAFLGTPHMIAALCTTRGLLSTACEAAGVRPRKLHDDLLSIVGQHIPSQSEFPLSRQTLTPRLVRMLVDAARAAEAGGRLIGEAELLGSFLSDGGTSLDLVTSAGLVPHIRRAIEQRPKEGRDQRVSVLGGASAISGSEHETPTLDTLGLDLTAEAREGRLATVLGREPELQRIVNVLMRSEQRNPLLTGEAGVGKTALAMALAQRIADGGVPARLAGMRVVEINGASLVGGTSYRGELEARIKGLLEDCERDVILFIDEAHAVFAPRSSSGQPAEIPNHFKAALASGKIAVVGATTEAEYRRWIEEDPALKRRFERIEIAELSPELTRTILVDLAPRYEREYEVPITPDAVDASIELSVRFMPEQSLPDKAKKLLMDSTISVSSDLAMSRTTPGSVDTENATPSKRVVTRLDVARQVSLKTGAPLDRVARGNLGWWVGLEDRLCEHVVGQERAVMQVARALVAGRLNSAGRKQPQAVFLFGGPPGVGKVELARGMAEEIYGSDKALLQLDMGDFSEAHSISRLIGSPPGYVGYQDEDALVTPLRRSPSRVVLLTDIDLAHPRIQDRLLRLFREGEIADTRGLKANATHAIFVLTIDVDLLSGAGIGFGRDQSDEISGSFARAAPELTERLSGYPVEFVAFDSLKTPSADLGRRLLQRRIEHFRDALRDEYGIELAIGPTVIEELQTRVAELDDARRIERLFRELVVDPVSLRLVEGVTGSQVAIEIDALEPEPA